MICPDAKDQMKPYRRPPMALGFATAAQVRLIVWCKACQHQVEPDPAEMAARHGADSSVLDWRERLIGSEYSSREVDFVVTGTARRAGRITIPSHRRWSRSLVAAISSPQAE